MHQEHRRRTDRPRSSFRVLAHLTLAPAGGCHFGVERDPVDSFVIGEAIELVQRDAGGHPADHVERVDVRRAFRLYLGREVARVAVGPEDHRYLCPRMRPGERFDPRVHLGGFVSVSVPCADPSGDGQGKGN
jgi:hypothetical protein